MGEKSWSCCLFSPTFVSVVDVEARLPSLDRIPGIIPNPDTQ
jgi:hypothetical protein